MSPGQVQLSRRGTVVQNLPILREKREMNFAIEPHTKFVKVYVKRRTPVRTTFVADLSIINKNKKKNVASVEISAGIEYKLAGRHNECIPVTRTNIDVLICRAVCLSGQSTAFS